MKYAILAVAFVMLAGTFHMMFIMYDYLYYDNDQGVFNIIADIFNDTMLPEYSANAWNQTQMLYQAFGIGRFVWMGVALLCFAVEVVKRPQMEE